MGFAVATHYCGGQAVKSKLVLGNGTIDCGMKDTGNRCESHAEKSTINKKSCCENHYLSAGADENLKPSIEEIKINANFVYAFTYILIQLLYPESEQDIAFNNYSPPPPRNRDVSVLFQTFLI